MDTIIPGSHRELLDAKRFAFIATIGPRAAPHVSPTWYLWDADTGQLLISLTTDRQKYRNLQRKPHVAVCISDPADPYRYLELRGKVDVFDLDENRNLINTLTKKYVGLDEHTRDQPSDVRVVVRISADYARCFG